MGITMHCWRYNLTVFGRVQAHGHLRFVEGAGELFCAICCIRESRFYLLQSSHSNRMSVFRRKFKADETRNRNSLRSRRLLPVEVGNPFLGNLATDLLTKPILSGFDEREKSSHRHGMRRRRARYFDVGNNETEMKSPNTSGCSPMVPESSPNTFKLPTLPTLLKKQVSCDSSLPVPHPSKFRKVHSTSEVTIVKALDKDEGEDLVGDFSRSHCLPFIAESAKHQDLKSIKHSTVSSFACNVLFYIDFSAIDYFIYQITDFYYHCTILWCNIFSPSMKSLLTLQSRI